MQLSSPNRVYGPPGSASVVGVLVATELVKLVLVVAKSVTAVPALCMVSALLLILKLRLACTCCGLLFGLPHQPP